MAEGSKKAHPFWDELYILNIAKIIITNFILTDMWSQR